MLSHEYEIVLNTSLLHQMHERGHFCELSARSNEDMYHSGYY